MNFAIGIILFTPFIFLCFWLEHKYLSKKTGKGYSSFFFFQNLQQAQGQQVMNVIGKILVTPLMYALYEYRLFTLENNFINVILVFMVFDMGHYWFHRLSHQMQFLWGLHLVHHSANDFDLSLSLRNPWFIQVVAASWQLFIVLLGVHPTLLLSIIGVGYLLAFWHHLKVFKPRPIIEKVFITASLHRVHHSKNEGYADKNFGLILSIWDRMFGTFAQEQEDKPCEIGIRMKTEIANPLWQNIYYFSFIIQLMKRAPSLKEAIKVPFRDIKTIPQWINSTEYRNLHDSIASSEPFAGAGESRFKLLVGFALGLELITLTYLYFSNNLDTTNKMIYGTSIIGLLFVFGLFLDRYQRKAA